MSFADKRTSRVGDSRAEAKNEGPKDQRFKFLGFRGQHALKLAGRRAIIYSLVSTMVAETIFGAAAPLVPVAQPLPNPATISASTSTPVSADTSSSVNSEFSTEEIAAENTTRDLQKTAGASTSQIPRDSNSETFKNEEGAIRLGASGVVSGSLGMGLERLDGGIEMAASKDNKTNPLGGQIMVAEPRPVVDQEKLIQDIEKSKADMRTGQKWVEMEKRLIPEYGYKYAARLQEYIAKKEEYSEKDGKKLSENTEWIEAKSIIDEKIDMLKRIRDDDLKLHDKWYKAGKITLTTMVTWDNETKKLFGFWSANYLEMLDGLATAMISKKKDVVEETMASLRKSKESLDKDCKLVVESKPAVKFINKYDLIGWEFLSPDVLNEKITPMIDNTPARLLLLSIQDTEAYTNYMADKLIDSDPKLLAKLKDKNQLWGKADAKKNEGPLRNAEDVHKIKNADQSTVGTRFTADKLAEIKLSRSSINNSSVDPEEERNSEAFTNNPVLAKGYREGKDEIHWNKMAHLDISQKSNSSYLYNVGDQAEINASQYLYPAVKEAAEAKTRQDAITRMKTSMNYQPPVLLASLAVAQRINALWLEYPKSVDSESINKASNYPTLGKDLKKMGGSIVPVDENEFRYMYSVASLNALFVKTKKISKYDSPDMVTDIVVTNPGETITIGQKAGSEEVVNKVSELDIKATFKASAPIFTGTMASSYGTGIDKDGKIAQKYDEKAKKLKWNGQIIWNSEQEFERKLLRVKGKGLELIETKTETMKDEERAKLIGVELTFNGQKTANNILLGASAVSKVPDFAGRAAKAGLDENMIKFLQVPQDKVAAMSKVFSAKEMQTLFSMVATNANDQGTYKLVYTWMDAASRKQTAESTSTVFIQPQGKLHVEIVGNNTDYDNERNTLHAVLKITATYTNRKVLDGNLVDTEVETPITPEILKDLAVRNVLRSSLFMFSIDEINDIARRAYANTKSSDFGIITKKEYDKIAFSEIPGVDAEKLKKAIGMTGDELAEIKKARFNKKEVFNGVEIKFMEDNLCMSLDMVTKAEKSGVSKKITRRMRELLNPANLMDKSTLDLLQTAAMAKKFVIIEKPVPMKDRPGYYDLNLFLPYKPASNNPLILEVGVHDAAETDMKGTLVKSRLAKNTPIFESSAKDAAPANINMNTPLFIVDPKSRIQEMEGKTYSVVTFKQPPTDQDTSQNGTTREAIDYANATGEAARKKLGDRGLISEKDYGLYLLKKVIEPGGVSNVDDDQLGGININYDGATAILRPTDPARLAQLNTTIDGYTTEYQGNATILGYLDKLKKFANGDPSVSIQDALDAYVNSPLTDHVDAISTQITTPKATFETTTRHNIYSIEIPWADSYLFDNDELKLYKDKGEISYTAFLKMVSRKRFFNEDQVKAWKEAVLKDVALKDPEIEALIKSGIFDYKVIGLVKMHKANEEMLKETRALTEAQMDIIEEKCKANPNILPKELYNSLQRFAKPIKLTDEQVDEITSTEMNLRPEVKGFKVLKAFMLDQVNAETSVKLDYGAGNIYKSEPYKWGPQMAGVTLDLTRKSKDPEGDLTGGDLTILGGQGAGMLSYTRAKPGSLINLQGGLDNLRNEMNIWGDFSSADKKSIAKQISENMLRVLKETPTGVKNAFGGSTYSLFALNGRVTYSQDIDITHLDFWFGDAVTFLSNMAGYHPEVKPGAGIKAGVKINYAKPLFEIVDKTIIPDDKLTTLSMADHATLALYLNFNTQLGRYGIELNDKQEGKITITPSLFFIKKGKFAHWTPITLAYGKNLNRKAGEPEDTYYGVYLHADLLVPFWQLTKDGWYWFSDKVLPRKKVTEQ